MGADRGTCPPCFLGVDIKIVATRCQILRLKCTKFNCRWLSAADLAGEAYRTPSDTYLDLRGHTSKGRDGRERGME